jgi:2-dehydropantoate 2-reductase
MRLLVVGAGSTGGYVGARLAEAGRDVTFLVRPARAAQLRSAGLHIRSPRGNITIKPQAIRSQEITKAFDMVLLAIKSFQLDTALTDLTPAVDSNTLILPVLNGMRHMDVIAKRFASQNLVGCALQLATILEDDGTITQLTPLQDFAYGERDSSTTARIRDLDSFMKSAEIGARLSDSILREMWQKWILLAALGGITCLMRGSIGEVMACAGGEDFAEAVLDEIVAIVRVVGEPPAAEFLSSARKQLTAKGSTLTSSMFRDLTRGRPIEAEAIVGDLLGHGQSAQISTPLLATVYAHVQVYQNRLDAQSNGPRSA